MISKIRKYLDKFVRRIYPFFQPSYIKKIKGSKHNIIVSYLAAPFFHKNDIRYLNHHQNRKETLIIGDILNSMSISHKFVRLDKPLLSYKGFDVVFGVEPNFVKAAISNPNALKIYYATGAYCKHQNTVVKQRTDEFNRLHNVKIPYYRLTREHDAVEIADVVIQIGSKYTLQTYPKELRNKIITIRQSCHNYNLSNFISEKLQNYSIRDFVWMGSSGSILKGLDIVLDYFIGNPDLTLHVFGSIDYDVWDYYEAIINGKSNIKIYGVCDLDSDIIREIGMKSSFVILPSASEGCPGSVLNMAKLGCIPIVTPVSAFDGIENFGVLINAYSTKALAEAISTVLNWSENTIRQKIVDVYNFSNKNFSQESFRSDMQKALQNAIKQYEISKSSKG